MKKLHFVFVTSADMPEGGGNTTRLKMLCSTLIDMGHAVRVLLENAHGGVDQALLQVKGTVAGIEYEYINGHVHTPSGFALVFDKIKASQKIKSRLQQLHKQAAVDILWFNQAAYHTIAPLLGFATKYRIPTVHSYEDGRIRGKGFVRNLIYQDQYWADRYLSPKVDALVVISSFLRTQYQAYAPSQNIHLIPTIIELNKWECQPKDSVPTPPRIVYTGSFFGFDEVEKVVKAVKILHDQGTPAKLDLIGYNKKEPDYMQEIASLINTLQMQDHIILHGFVRFEALKKHLCSADLLIGIRKDDGWSNTGFSTKLSEYLATGRPVLCASLGDNTYYLKDGENAYLIPPGSPPEDIAAKMTSIFQHPDQAQAVGMAGLAVAKNHFDKEVIKKKMTLLITQLLQSSALRDRKIA